MIVSTLALALLFASGLEQSSPADDTREPMLQQSQEKVEAARQAAIRINDLAANIHSENDAENFVDAVAAQAMGNDHWTWTILLIRQRVAHAEYEAVGDPARLIPEQRIVAIWNEYVRELNAPEETLVTVAELHNLRDAMYAGSLRMWKKERFPQSMWIAPNIYAVGGDGKVADGCRAVEALKIFHDLFRFPEILQSARDRVQKGILVSDLMAQPKQEATSRPVAQSSLKGSTQVHAVMSAQYGYLQAHSEQDYQRLLERLLEELFPAN